MKKYFVFFIGMVLIACGSDDNVANRDYNEENEAEILAYIDAKGLNALRSETGLYYVIDELGLGVNPGPTDDVTVATRGTLRMGRSLMKVMTMVYPSIYSKSSRDGQKELLFSGPVVVVSFWSPHAWPTEIQAAVKSRPGRS